MLGDLGEGQARCTCRFSRVKPGMMRKDFKPLGPRKQVYEETQMLTHEAGNEHPGDTLLPHLLDLGLVTRSDGSTHHRQRVDMSDRADSGSCEPGQAEQPTEATQRANQKQVKMEAGTLE